MVALSSRAGRICARRLGGRRSLFVRPAEEPPGGELPVPAERFTLRVAESRCAGARQWLVGAVSGVRLDTAELGLEPLALVELGPWDAGRDQLAPARPDPARCEFEMERIPPAGYGAGTAEAPLLRALDLWSEEDPAAAERLLGELLHRDLRCLEAHSCLGYFAFKGSPGRGGPALARRHYAAGLGIGELSLPPAFGGVMPWSRLGNRPFLRCLYGHSICLWRLGDLAGARTGFERLCRLNPGDQLAARLALDRIDHGGRAP